MEDQPQTPSTFSADFQNEVTAQAELQMATQPPETLSPDQHARLDMASAVEEESVRHWGHIIFIIFGFIAVASSLAMVFVMSVAFTAAENSTGKIVRALANPSLALILAYITLISLLLGLIGLGLGKWHSRVR